MADLPFPVILPGPPGDEFYVDGEPAGWMSGERFAEVKRRAAKEGL